MQASKAQALEGSRLAGKLIALFPASFLKAVDRLWVRAEVGKGVGSVDLYGQADGGNVKHFLDDQKLVGDLWECVYRHGDPARSWTVAMLRWQGGRDPEVTFGYDAVDDLGMTAQRRAAWEATEFAGEQLERLDPF